MLDAAILTIGDELLSGEVVDGHAAELARFLSSRGVCVRRIVSVGDAVAEIAGAVRAAVRRPLLLVTGGLGPTGDDRTVEGVARGTGRAVVRHPDAEEHLRRRLAGRGRGLSNANLRQAELPEGAVVLGNPLGTAPAFSLEHDGCLIVCLPGVPAELRAILAELLGPLLERRFRLQPRPAIRLRVFGITEARLATLLETELEAPAWLRIAYRPRFPEILLTLEAPGPEQERELESLAARIEGLLGPRVYVRGEIELPAVVGALLRERGKRLALAVSCTGGLIAKLLTDTPGSSEFLDSAAVTYSNAAKERMLGVPGTLIQTHGAVSEPVAAAMARGARERAGADYALAVTGIAGPGGGTPAKPVGTVYIGLADPQEVFVRRFSFPGWSRAAVRRVTAYTALSALRLLLLSGNPWFQPREERSSDPPPGVAGA